MNLSHLFAMPPTLAIALLGLLAPLPAFAAERSFPVTAFDKVRVAGSADVSVTTGQAVSVRAVGDEEVLDKLSITVSGGELTVTYKSGLKMGWSDKGTKVFVTVPRLTAVSLPGSGDLRVNDVAGPVFDASLNGSGDLLIDKVAVDRIAFMLGGSGDVSATGTCSSATIALNGSGDMGLGNLRCKSVSISLNGSGDISAFATETAAISLNGSGDVMVRGGARCTQSKRGSGDISCG